MKHAIPFLAVALAALLFLPACGDKGSGGGIATSSIAGAWELDTSELKKAMKGEFEKQLEGKSEQEVAMMKGMLEPMLAMFDKASLSVDIKADGTWTGKTNFPEGGPGGGMKLEEASGTWSLDGDKLEIVKTHEDGEKSDKPDTLTGTWKGDEIRVTDKDGDMPVEMVMRRK